jgi:hypothetical protein
MLARLFALSPYPLEGLLRAGFQSVMRQLNKVARLFPLNRFALEDALC